MAESDTLQLITLPTDSLLRIFQSLAIQDLGRLSLTCKRFHEVEQDDSLWKNLAKQKWGSVLDEFQHPPSDEATWRGYVKHRLASYSLPLSPLNLIQENYPDPWQHIVCCILCSRTTGGETIRRTIASFFSKYPTASECINGIEEEQLVLIRPLGLQVQRIASIRSMSNDFLLNNWQSPEEFKGCGKFVSDSFNIFCRGHRSLSNVSDVNLQRYLRWMLGADEQKEKQKVKNVKRVRKAVKNDAKTNAKRGKKNNIESRRKGIGLRTRSSSLK